VTSDVRASDADRERVARELGVHAGEGRLSPEELDERVGAAYAARTRAELDALLADLPAPRPRPAPTQRDIDRARLLHRAGVGAIAIAVCIAIWAAAGASGSFWPVWVALVVVLSLARDAWRTLGPGAGLSDEQLGVRDRRERRLHR
jgi:hypothetical protein